MSQAIIITGMHRSGTSLVSSLLQRSGIHIGEKLIAANSANPRGYFEDVDFYEFHENLLHESKQTYLHVNGNCTFEPTESKISRAHELIAERAHRPLWGWKDPRTCLFLSFWKQLLPNARFLFVYRHPIEVLLSLLRRGEFDNHPSLMAGLHAWHVYNSNIQAFCDAHPDCCLLVHVDGVVQQPERFSQLLEEKLQLGFGLDSEAFNQIYQANELQKTPFSPALAGTLRKLCPGSLELYEQLNRQADLCGNNGPSDSDASPSSSPLADFIGSLEEPISLPAKHSLLQLLISSVAPELTERMLVRFDLAAKEIQQRVDVIWQHAQNLQRMNDGQADELKRDAARIESLSAELDDKSAHIESLTADSKRDSDRIEILTAALNRDSASIQILTAELVRDSARIDSLTAELHRDAARIESLMTELHRDAARIESLMTELERDADRIESLLAELNSIHGTFAWKVMRSYQHLKQKYKKVT